jgi:hypothetical protein
MEAPLIPVCNEPVPKRGGLLSRIFCTGLFFGTKGPLEPVLKPFFLPVAVFVKRAGADGKLGRLALGGSSARPGRLGSVLLVRVSLVDEICICLYFPILPLLGNRHVNFANILY